jgi:hypothetical protein
MTKKIQRIVHSEEMTKLIMSAPLNVEIQKN